MKIEVFAERDERAVESIELDVSDSMRSEIEHEILNLLWPMFHHEGSIEFAISDSIPGSKERNRMPKPIERARLQGFTSLKYKGADNILHAII